MILRQGHICLFLSIYHFLCHTTATFPSLDLTATHPLSNRHSSLDLTAIQVRIAAATTLAVMMEDGAIAVEAAKNDVLVREASMRLFTASTFHTMHLIDLYVRSTLWIYLFFFPWHLVDAHPLGGPSGNAPLQLSSYQVSGCHRHQGALDALGRRQRSDYDPHWRRRRGVAHGGDGEGVHTCCHHSTYGPAGSR